MKGDKSFEASAILSWLELWQLILVRKFEKWYSTSTDKTDSEEYIYVFELYYLEAIERRWRQVIPSYGFGVT